MEGNTIETTTKQVTTKDQADFPYKARKMFGLITEKEMCNEEKTLNSIGLSTDDVENKKLNEQQQAEKLFGGNK